MRRGLVPLCDMPPGHVIARSGSSVLDHGPEWRDAPPPGTGLGRPPGRPRPVGVADPQPVTGNVVRTGVGTGAGFGFGFGLGLVATGDGAGRVGVGAAKPARAGSRPAGREGTDQPADRRGAVRLRTDRAEPRPAHLDQARLRQPEPDRGLVERVARAGRRTRGMSTGHEYFGRWRGRGRPVTSVLSGDTYPKGRTP